jgi:hypothetical protein
VFTSIGAESVPRGRRRRIVVERCLIKCMLNVLSEEVKRICLRQMGWVQTGES